MHGMLFAEFAILLDLYPVCGIFLILESIVVALFAFGASERYLGPHGYKPPKKITPRFRSA